MPNLAPTGCSQPRETVPRGLSTLEGGRLEGCQEGALEETELDTPSPSHYGWLERGSGAGVGVPDEEDFCTCCATDRRGNGIVSSRHILGNGQEAGKQQTSSSFLPAWLVLLSEPEMGVRKRT